jgi:polysaccharide export outer membrane protein
MTKKSFYILLLINVLFTSCIPVKDLVYLQDKNTSTEQNTIAEAGVKPYRLQANDVLSISIKAIDPKLVSIFNTTESAGAGGGKNESSLYFDGFTVDDHGNIRMPLLGEINVIGYTLEEVT